MIPVAQVVYVTTVLPVSYMMGMIHVLYMRAVALIKCARALFTLRGKPGPGDFCILAVVWNFTNWRPSSH